MRRLLVVAGLIGGRPESGHADDLLISRRPDRGHLARAWELPGGKVEPGEAPAAALARELLEELGVRVRVGEIHTVGHHLYEGVYEVVLLVYRCVITSGEPQALQVAEFRWVSPAELLEVPLPPADRPVLDRLRRELRGAP